MSDHRSPAPICADYTEVTNLRTTDPGAIARAWQARATRPTVRGDGKIIDWLNELTADCPKKSAHSMNDPCGAPCPDLRKVL